MPIVEWYLITILERRLSTSTLPNYAIVTNRWSVDRHSTDTQPTVTQHDQLKGPERARNCSKNLRNLSQLLTIINKKSSLHQTLHLDVCFLKVMVLENSKPQRMLILKLHVKRGSANVIVLCLHSAGTAGNTHCLCK